MQVSVYADAVVLTFLKLHLRQAGKDAPVPVRRIGSQLQPDIHQITVFILA